MKNSKKILILLLILLFLTVILSTTVNAETNLDYYKPSPSGGGNNDELTKKAGDVLGFIQVIGSILSVIALAVIGVKYMLGSVEEKAEYKKTMIPYIIGAALVFASSNLVSILYELGKEINQ